jgi:hypothetical protein
VKQKNFPYFDDTSIFSHNWKAHIQHLHDVFTRIRGANLTIKRSKYHLGHREVSVVGHIAGKGQIKVQPDKVRAVKEGCKIISRFVWILP